MIFIIYTVVCAITFILIAMGLVASMVITDEEPYTEVTRIIMEKGVMYVSIRITIFVILWPVCLTRYMISVSSKGGRSK